MTKTKVICAWCEKFLHWMETPSGGVSHGLCEDCFRREMRKLDGGEHGRPKAKELA